MPTATATPDLSALFSSAGYSFQDFTPSERECIAEKVSKLRDEGKPQDQAVATAISMCAPSKARAKAHGVASASFQADPPDQTKIKIRGGDYRWTRTDDGYVVFHDVPLMAEVKKGVKNAPEDQGQKELEDFVTKAQERYNGTNPFCATAFVGHNPDIPLTHPDFAGFTLPIRVAKYKFDDGERWAVFGDLKINEAHFQKAKRGELPYTSPEVNWLTHKITGLAFLPTRPPYFEFALFTVGDEFKEDKPATFRAEADPECFAANGNGSCPECERKDQELADLKAKMAQYMASPKSPTEVAKMDANDKTKGATGPADSPKTSPLPVEPASPVKAEPVTAKMDASLDPKMAAQFEAQGARIKALEDERAKEKSEAAKKARVDWAMAELKGFILAETTPAMVAKFAAHDEGALKEFVGELKKILQREPPSSMADFKGVSIDSSDPALAKFSQKGPETLEKARVLAARYRAKPEGSLPYTEEQFIQYHLDAKKTG